MLSLLLFQLRKVQTREACPPTPPYAGTTAAGALPPRWRYRYVVRPARFARAVCSCGGCALWPLPPVRHSAQGQAERRNGQEKRLVWPSAHTITTPSWSHTMTPSSRARAVSPPVPPARGRAMASLLHVCVLPRRSAGRGRRGTLCSPVSDGGTDVPRGPGAVAGHATNAGEREGRDRDCTRGESEDALLSFGCWSPSLARPCGRRTTRVEQKHLPQPYHSGTTMQRLRQPRGRNNFVGSCTGAWPSWGAGVPPAAAGRRDGGTPPE